MHVRDAAQDDAEAIAALADLPVAAATHLIVERTVRVARDPGDDGSGAGDADGEDQTGDADGEKQGGDMDAAETLRGFVAFDARPGVVHVTQLAGDREAVARLLEEPASFADSEEMAVEAVVPESAPDLRAAVEAFGFDPAGDGPAFGEEPTRRYRLDE